MNEQVIVIKKPLNKKLLIKLVNYLRSEGYKITHEDKEKYLILKIE